MGEQIQQDSSLAPFEGPEKRLELKFQRSSGNDIDCAVDLRKISSENINTILDLAKCSILSKTVNDSFDAYLLSESSCFVFPNKIILKTCGTTTLLNCILKVMECAEGLGATLESVMYSRKNLMFPNSQVFPHTSWQHELDFLNRMFICGEAFTIGPLNSDHWNVFIADYRPLQKMINTSPRESHKHCPNGRKNCVLEIMMHRLDPVFAKRFVGNGENPSKKFPGMAELIKGFQTDEFNFEPCGYSMNGLYGDDYSTIHVTPQEEFSYASFETSFIENNSQANTALICRVLSMFNPGVFTLCIYGEVSIDIDEIDGFQIKHKSDQRVYNHHIAVFSFEKAEAIEIAREIPTFRSLSNTLKQHTI